MLVLTCAFAIAFPQDPTLDDALTRLAEPLVQSDEVPGLVIAWIDGADQEHTIALGKRSRDDAKPIPSDGIFEIGSLTKLFTGLTLAQLATAKEIDLHATIDSLLPPQARPATESGVELIQLATHRGGMPDIPSNLERDLSRFFVDYSQYDAAKLDTFLREFTPSPKPGRRYVYSNAGFGVLGHVLAVHAKQSLPELMRQRVIAPLGLETTGYSVSDDHRPRVQIGHDPNGDPVAPMEFNALSGCGGLRSSAADLLRFARAFLTPSGPLADAITLASTPVAKTPQGVGIALDWMLALDAETLFHSGQTDGFTSFLCVHREKRLAVVVLANGATTQLELLGVGVLRTLLGVAVTPLTVKMPAPLAATPAEAEARIAELRGSYALKGGPTLVISGQQDRLYAQLPGQPNYHLLPQSDGSFVYRTIEAAIEFEAADPGPAPALELRQNGRRLRFERVD